MNTITAGELIDLLKQIHPKDKVAINIDPVLYAARPPRGMAGALESDQPVIGLSIVGSTYGYRATIQIGELE